MKKAVAVAILAGLSALAVNASAEQKTDASGKELCILYTESCSNKIQGLQQKVKALQARIATGATVYNPQQIDQLEQKLKEAEDIVDKMLSVPPQRR